MTSGPNADLLVLYDEASEEEWDIIMSELDDLWKIARDGQLTPVQIDRIIQLAKLDWLAEDDDTWHPEITKTLQEIYKR